MDADVRGMALWPLLEKIAVEAGWHIFVEPDTTHTTSAKFKDLPSGDALKMLLGNLNFALVPRTNGVPHLYVFRTNMKNATQRVLAPKAVARHVPNELLVKLKPGTDVDALAKLLGAKIIGRNDKLGLYRLQFDNADATDAALASLKNNSDVLAVDYNYYFDPPATPQLLANAPVGPVSLTLDPATTGDPCNPVVGLIDTPVQSLGSQLDSFSVETHLRGRRRGHKHVRPHAWDGDGRDDFAGSFAVGRREQFRQDFGRGCLRRDPARRPVGTWRSASRRRWTTVRPCST